MVGIKIFAEHEALEMLTAFSGLYAKQHVNGVMIGENYADNVADGNNFDINFVANVCVVRWRQCRSG